VQRPNFREKCFNKVLDKMNVGSGHNPSRGSKQPVVGENTATKEGVDSPKKKLVISRASNVGRTSLLLDLARTKKESFLHKRGGATE